MGFWYATSCSRLESTDLQNLRGKIYIRDSHGRLFARWYDDLDWERLGIPFLMVAVHNQPTSIRHDSSCSTSVQIIMFRDVWCTLQCCRFKQLINRVWVAVLLYREIAVHPYLNVFACSPLIVLTRMAIFHPNTVGRCGSYM